MGFITRQHCLTCWCFQEIIKKFFKSKKVEQQVVECCELITANNDVCEAAAEEEEDQRAEDEVGEKEWWIIIKLQVDRLGKYCSKIVVEQAELCEVCSHKEPITVVSALGAGTRAGHSPHICDCSAPECRGTGVWDKGTKY